MARREPNRQLAALLTEADWSAADLARTVNALGAAQGVVLRYDRTAVAHWLTGCRPRPPVPDLIAAAFTRRCGRLVTVKETGLVKTAQRPAPPRGQRREERDAVHRLTDVCRADADPVRRAPMTRSVYNLANTTDILTFEPVQRAPAQIRSTGRPATSADVERLQEMVCHFADLSERHGGAHARTALAIYVADDMNRPLTSPASSASLRRDLFTGAAQLTHVLARMTTDSGHAGLAQRYYTASLDLSREAGDSRLYAITLRAMSLQALQLGYPEHAHRMADAAVDIAGPHAAPATQAFLLSQRALTFSCQRQRRAALADLIAAEKQHDRASSRPNPFTHYPRSSLDYQRAQTLLALGDRVGALQAFLSSVRARSDHQRRPRALTCARLAETLLRTGQLDAACDAWHSFLDCYPHLRSVAVAHALTRLRANLRPHQHQEQAAVVLQRARAITQATALR